MPARAATGVPVWLALRAGAVARVDVAPWLVSDEPESALTESPESLRRNFSDDGSRPPDVVYRPIGARVRVVRVLPGGRIARVRGLDGDYAAYALVDRLIPEVPAGTRLRAAGGFSGFADFYPTLQTPQRAAERLETGLPIVALETGAAPYDPDTADLVRVRVRVLAGALRGRTGWLAVGYTGLPVAAVAPQAVTAEKACRCRLLEFRVGADTS